MSLMLINVTERLRSVIRVQPDAEITIRGDDVICGEENTFGRDAEGGAQTCEYTIVLCIE